MKTLSYLIARNCKLFFKDKGVFLDRKSTRLNSSHS